MTSRIRSVRLDDDDYKALQNMSVSPYTASWQIQEAVRQYLAGKAPKKEVAPVKKPKPDDQEFDQIWELYEKKGSKKVSKARFAKLSRKTRELIYNHLPVYLLSTPDKKYRKDFERYISNECWNDEVITNGQQNQPGRTTAGRKLSVVERTRQRNAEREQARRAEERALDGSLVGEAAGDVWPPVEQPVRGDDTGELGTVIEGSCTTTD